MVRFGFRVPSLTKRIAARTSVKRLVKNKLGLRAPRGWGWITNPKKANYNRVYKRTTRGCLVLVVMILTLAAAAIWGGIASVGAALPAKLRTTPSRHGSPATVSRRKSRRLMHPGNTLKAVPPQPPSGRGSHR